MWKRNIEVFLYNPKYIENLANVVRSCACFGLNRVYYSGDRINLNQKRVPRGLRMYKEIELINNLPSFNNKYPIAVEVGDYTRLHKFSSLLEKNIILVFGPEDGNIPSHILSLCFDFITIDTLHPLNLANCVSILLYKLNEIEKNTQ